jgi:hypothetical protein
MARDYYIRGDKGRFAGSIRRGGSGGARRGRMAKGGGGSGDVALRRRYAGYTERNAGPNGRHYIQRNAAGTRRVVKVQQIKNGKLVTPKDSVWTRRAVGGRTPTARSPLGATGARNRVGSPINGNKNVRYVSRTHAVTRISRAPADRAVGRAFSAGANRRAAARNTLPRNGYVVTYGPRFKPTQ